MKKLKILKIDDKVCDTLSNYPVNTVLKYKNLSINIMSDCSIDIKTPNNSISAGTKALSNYYILYNEDKDNFILIHQANFEIIKEHIYDINLINFNDFSICI